MVCNCRPSRFLNDAQHVTVLCTLDLSQLAHNRSSAGAAEQQAQLMLYSFIARYSCSLHIYENVSSNMLHTRPVRVLYLPSATLAPTTKCRCHEPCAAQVISIIPADHCPCLPSNLDDIDSTIDISAFKFVTNCMPMTSMQHTAMQHQQNGLTCNTATTVNQILQTKALQMEMCLCLSAITYTLMEQRLHAKMRTQDAAP